MSTVTFQELQNNPLALLGRVEAGESIVVTRDDKPVAEMRPVSAPDAGLRPYGLDAGRLVVPDDFDDPLPEEILESFYQ